MGDFLSFVTNHFWHAAPIIAVGVFGLAIILERTRALHWVYPLANEDKFFESIQESVMKGKVSEAVSICDRYPGKPTARVVKTALLRSHQPKELIEDGLALVVEDATQKIQKRTHFLAMIANVATLLGLLGTIAGLVDSFKSMGGENAGEKTVMLAQGISTAMSATMLGLSVAVPAMVAFSFLINKTNRLTSSVETGAIRIMDILKQRYFESEAKVVTSKYGTDGRVA